MFTLSEQICLSYVTVSFLDYSSNICVSRSCPCLCDYISRSCGNYLVHATWSESHHNSQPTLRANCNRLITMSESTTNSTIFQDNMYQLQAGSY